MSSFTLPLKKVFELCGGEVTYAENGAPTYSGHKIGLESYPIFDENYRQHLNGLFFDRYWNREIGQESVDLFKLALRRKMNELMPFTNKLYLSLAVEFDPLSTVDLRTLSSNTVEQDVTGTGTATNETTSQSGSRSVNSETPQTMLSGSADYASFANDVTTTGESGVTSEENSTQTTNVDNNGDVHVTGYQGAASELLMKYRESLISVDIMLLDQLEDLFMLVWDTNDSFTKGQNSWLSLL